jgi:hypothetical protein
MGTHHDSEMKGAQIDIGLMLHVALLSITRKEGDEECHQDDYSLSVHVKYNAGGGFFIISTSYKLLKYLPKIRYLSKNIPIFASSKISN